MMNEEAYQDQMDDDAQFEAEQQALSDAVFEMEEEFYEMAASIIACEVEDYNDINWDVVDETVQDGKNVTKYIEEAEWEKAHDIMIETLM
ncbi:hypothetical protein [Pseudolactococcus raffinolactis]|uniref:hypothetical protein n=1 Tax=Pseudolactococcus raffinolactis TaxID=1366 RepID=UPI001C7054F5|nr:hypothetical protein [Lactococcus raffinolactis]